MSDGIRERMKMTAGMDLGDKYTHLCLIDTQNDKVIEESRLRTTPEAMRCRFDSEQPLHIPIEVGTHSPWISRLLTECAHEVLIATALVITIEPTHRTHSARRNRGRPVRLQPRSPDRALQSVPHGCELQLSVRHP